MHLGNSGRLLTHPLWARCVLTVQQVLRVGKRGPSCNCALAAFVSFQDLFGRVVTSLAEAGIEEPGRVAGGGGGGGGAWRWRGSRGSRGSGRLATPSGSQSASAAAAARGAARGGRSHIWRRRRPPTSPSDSAAPGGFEFWLPGKGPFLGERGLSFVRLRPLRAPLQAPPRPACARDCAAALTAPFICLWSRRAAPEAGDPAVSCSRGRRLARMTPR